MLLHKEKNNFDGLDAVPLDSLNHITFKIYCLCHVKFKEGNTMINNSKLVQNEEEIYKFYNIFKVRKIEFIKEIKNIDPEMLEKFYWQDIKTENILLKKNWYTAFVPSNWLYDRKSLGVYYSIRCAFSSKFATPQLRLYVNVEAPIKEMYKDKFSKDVITLLHQEKIEITDVLIYPNAGKKLMEFVTDLQDENAYKKLIQQYKSLTDFNRIVSVDEH